MPFSHEKMGDMEVAIIHTLKYFAFFEYVPTFEEVHTFLSIKIKKTSLKKELATLISKKNIQQINLDGENTPRYTLGEYSISIKKSSIKLKNSMEKVRKAKLFIRLLSFFPQIKLIGLSGSVAMKNAEADDDTDLFIISSAKRMWTARFIALTVSHLMGVRRKRNDQNVQNKICLNLFFDESDLSLPKRKHTEYGAHEVLQMKPIVDKSATYQRFLDVNRWVVKIFPNAKVPTVIPTKVGIPLKTKIVGNFIEYVFKNAQMYLIRKHQTSEIISDTQLWFFPDDFEKKLSGRKQ